MFKQKTSNQLKQLVSWWYRQLILNQEKETGNILVVSIIMGLLVLGATSLSLFNSSKDQINAQAGEYTKKVVAIGELGVNRIHNFLAQNPKVAMYNKADWVTNVNNGNLATTGDETVVNNTGDTASCGTVTGSGNSSSSGPLSSSDVSSIQKQAVDANSFDKGGFVIQNYTVTPDATTIQAANDDISIPAGTVIGRGTLVIDGDLNPSATDLSSIFTGNSVSRSRIEVVIPITKKDPADIPYPGVWVGDQSTSSWENNVDADVMISAEDCSNLQLHVEEGRQFILSSAKFPDMPLFPQSTGSGANVTYGQGVYALGSMKSKTVAVTLPRTVANSSSQKGVNAVTTDDVPGSDGVYRYIVDDLNANGGSTMKITAGKKVYLYLRGEFSMGGTSSVDHSFTCSDPTNTTLCDAEKTAAGFAPENFRIYGYGYKTGTTVSALNGQTDGTTFSTDPKLCLKGSGNTEGFIFAPGYQGAVSGGGSDDAFVGTVWIKRWADSGGACGSNTNNTVVTQDTSSWNTLGFVPQGVAPTIGSSSSWKRNAR